jgi:predicted  nucleic acid-binding Zn-ribbon protein
MSIEYIAAANTQDMAKAKEAVRGEGETEDIDRTGQVVVRPHVPGKGEYHASVHDKEETERGQDRVPLELVPVCCTPRQWIDQNAVYEPVRRKGDRDGKRHPDNRIDLPQRVHPVRRERPGHQELAIGEIEDACDPVLQIEADGDQRIHAAEHEAA